MAEVINGLDLIQDVLEETIEELFEKNGYHFSAVCMIDIPSREIHTELYTQEGTKDIKVNLPARKDFVLYKIGHEIFRKYCKQEGISVDEN